MNRVRDGSPSQIRISPAGRSASWPMAGQSAMVISVTPAPTVRSSRPMPRATATSMRHGAAMTRQAAFGPAVSIPPILRFNRCIATDFLPALRPPRLRRPTLPPARRPPQNHLAHLHDRGDREVNPLATRRLLQPDILVAIVFRLCVGDAPGEHRVPVVPAGPPPPPRAGTPGGL